MRFGLIGMALGLSLAAGPCAYAATAAPGPQASQLHVVARLPSTDGGWDYASFEPEHRRLFVAHEDEVLALDVDTGKLDPKWAPGDHLHEVLPIPKADLVLTTNSGDSSVRILTDAGAPKASLHVAADPDGAVYDPATGLAVVINGEPGVLTLVDPRKEKVVGEIQVGKGLEFGAVDGRGRAFVNIESQSAIAVVDLRKKQVVARYVLDGCKAPSGLAFVAGDRLITACHNDAAEILDARTGAKIANLTIGGFPDAVIYDPARKVAYIPTALDGKLNVIALAGPSNNTIVERVPTQVGARTGAVDPKTGKIYLPTAEYKLPVPKGQRPTTIPGTFVILVVGRH